MSETNKISLLGKYRNIFGNAQETIKAIQEFIKEDNNVEVKAETEEKPADSINRILQSTVCEDTSNDINKIIKNL